MILIYTPKITNRITYIFKLIFTELLNINVKFTNNLVDFNSYDGLKLNYSDTFIQGELFSKSAGLLTESFINDQSHSFIDFEDEKVFYPIHNKNAALPFDPFSASFYLVTRYEEYLPYLKDKYERFIPSQSIAFKNYFLKKPIINIWANKIADIIQEKYPSFTYQKPTYIFQPTYDIDSAYAYKLKGFIRSIGGYLKSIRNVDIKEMLERTKVLSGFGKDHFDTFDLQFDLQKKYDLHPIYFILFADYGDFDKNIPVNNLKFQSLIKNLADYANVGIHPSHASNKDISILKKEIDGLSNVLRKQITLSRQHFLKLNMPQTYRNLISLDITDDYSMGYASEIGFRASICSTYNFYDLELDVETNLRIHPFCFMEGTLRDYYNVNASKALDFIKPLIDEVKKVNGTFISLWHNESLSNQKRWVGWQEVYEEMIKYAL